ncbi:unnamed protein product [Larinioides sclopetarius]|uniref:Uncharacterized protein n=1 Tax=Larinioides sclopetarius TaxID=280406 RepID=A0AAV1ZYZ5_9ARAC
MLLVRSSPLSEEVKAFLVPHGGPLLVWALSSAPIFSPLPKGNDLRDAFLMRDEGLRRIEPEAPRGNFINRARQ